MVFDFQRINLTKLSRYVSFVLRHHPEEIDATVDEQGWMKVDELVHGMQLKGKYINQAILEHIVLTDEKQRYHYNEDHTKIRAAQGHSISVYIDMEIKVPPRYLYHGTSKQNYEKIKETKIKKMNRLYVHLSKDVKTAFQVGKRHGIPVVLVLDTEAMLQDGYQFYVATNGVWLCDDVDCCYIVKVIDRDDVTFPRE
ncbi:RNA 2'-phosphotransferase [[Clostridium] spiroforme]|nr:RNA 2'-phosphotransferase [Thomasclavelia spiroformis]